MDVSGFWSGQFHYPNDIAPPVKFDCEIIQTGHQISGLITEVEETGPTPNQIISANVEGSIIGKDISFLKSIKAII